MKVKDLIKQLEDYPEHEIDISIDISTSDDDAFNRAFSSELLEVVMVGKKITVLFDGSVNY